MRYRLKDTDLWKAYKEYNENIDSKSEKTIKTDENRDTVNVEI